MGLFSSETVISVASVVYNMAGDEESRPDYVKSLVAQNILSGTKDSIADTLRNGALNGPAMKFRQFYRWAKDNNNYGEIGLPTGNLTNSGAVNALVVEDVISDLIGEQVWVQRAIIGDADYGNWAEQWVLDNRPDDIDIAIADMTDNGVINITIGDLLVASFSPPGFDYESDFLYAWYNAGGGSSAGAVVTGTTVDLGTGAFPDLDEEEGWVLQEGPTVTPISGGTVTEWFYGREVLTGSTDSSSSYQRYYLHRYETSSPLNRSYRIDTQTFTGVSLAKLFIYRIGGDQPLLNSLVENQEYYGEFFPSIPVRINNRFLSPTNSPGAFTQVQAAFKKVLNSDVEDFIAQLEENPDLGDIDYAYIVFGVSLNTIDNSSRKYLYAFFERLQASQVGGANLYEQWQTTMAAYKDQVDAWTIWRRTAGRRAGDEPARPSLPGLSGNTIRIADPAGGLASNYDTRLSWAYINDGQGAGLGKVGARSGDTWFEALGNDEFFISVYGGGPIGIRSKKAGFRKIRLYWQRSASVYTYLDIVGMVHTNLIYKGKAVVIAAEDALSDLDESGFVIPLHYGTFRSISLMDASQMSSSCVLAVFNCYVAKKKKWYQTGIFKIFLVIVIAVISAVFMPAGLAIGLLGANLAIGTALGLTGLAAVIAGAVINALAAMVLISILSKVSTELFGEQLGAIIAAVAAIVIGAAASGFHNTGTMALNWGDLLKVDNLLAITNAVGTGYVNKLNAQTMGLANDMVDYAENAAIESDKIQQAFFKEFGYGAGQIDPMMFVDAAGFSEMRVESSATFLTRTLMTGSEVAEMSRDLLYNFAEYSLKLPDAYT